MAEVLVEHDYNAKEPNELTITKGDVIKEVVKKQTGWYEGVLRDKKGLFPDNVVKVIDKDSSVVLRNRKDASRIRQCRVVFSYKQDHEDELNLNVGDIIEIVGEEEEGWWRGLLNGKEGVFPSNFVEEIGPIPPKLSSSRENLTNSTTHEIAPPLFAKPVKKKCEVKFPYKAQNEDELTLKEGDIVTVLNEDGQDPGWWKGELNGLIGVFPDNFVTPISTEDDICKIEDKHPKLQTELAYVKPFFVNAQRKSLEGLNNDKTEVDGSGHKSTPPLPGKKPSIPLKKSPSNSGSSGGIFHGLKKKLVDVVDGATGSKVSPPKTDANEAAVTENNFDDVLRRPLLSDVRANRPKAPGRRLPSGVSRDSEQLLMNGNSEHQIEMVTESSVSTSCEIDTAEAKPKLREWEKHPAPWLEEMKLNQAKRSSNIIAGPDKLKLTPTEKSENEEKKVFKKEPSPVIDKSKSIASNLRKTPTNEFPQIRIKPSVPIVTRPQTIHNVTEIYNSTKLHSTSSMTTKVSSSIITKTPSPSPKVETTIENDTAEDSPEVVSNTSYVELEQRIARLEDMLLKQQVQHETAIEELRGKLQLESELRMQLQAKFEKLSLDGAIQQL